MGGKTNSSLIEPISTEDLRQFVREAMENAGGNARASTPEPALVIGAEREYIGHRRAKYGIAENAELTGLALSGGGIRSATFSLGVMQALAGAGLLKRMDYLSTVSGGGYIGSSLTWFLSRKKPGVVFGLDKDDFPYGVDPGKGKEHQASILNWLRQNGKYLTPGAGITLMSGIAIILRGIALNLLVWIPICTALLWLLLRGAEWLVNWIWGWIGGERMPAFAVQGYQTLVDISGLPGFMPGEKADIWEIESGIILIALCVAAVAAVLFLAFSLLYSLMTVVQKKDRTFWRYDSRRTFEIAMPVLLWTVAAAFVVASLPYVDAAITQWVDKSGGPLAAATGLTAGLWSFTRPRGTGSSPAPELLVVPALGTCLILYGVGLFSFQMALYLPREISEIANWPLGLLTLAGVTGLFVNINYVSIQRFYRDRLMETYLPEFSRIKSGRAGKSASADSAVLQSMQGEDAALGPCHLINTNIVLVNSRDKRRRLRGGDSFVLSAFYSGSNATGWVNTDSLLGGRLTLATAMSISGAAANPNAGSGGVGMTRSRSVSLLMALLNLRLGYWIPNLKRGWYPWSPNHFFPGLMQAFGKHHEEASFYELSDGGHFENLGLYELVRRRLRLIIACDGGADPTFGFSDLDTLRRRIGADFGARIDFEGGYDPEQLIPLRLKESAPNDAGYAVSADMAERGFLLGRIRYADGTEGKLIYIKTTMIDSLGFGVKAYKGAHHDFPDQTTADQFFDEEQFDAYLELGRDLGEHMIGETGIGNSDVLERLISDGKWPP